MYVWGSSHVTIEGFDIVGMPDAELDERGVPLHRGGAGIDIQVSDHITLRRNRADDNGRWGIITGFADDLVIEDNETSRSHAEHGIYVGNSADYPVIRRNHSWGNGSSGIQINADNQFDDAEYRARGGVVDGIIRGARVEHNVLHDNGLIGGAAINLDGVQDSLIADNVLYDNHASGVALFQYNSAEGSRRNQVVNNTIEMAEDGRYAIQIADCPTVDPATNVCAEASEQLIPEWPRPPAQATGSTGNFIVGNVLFNEHPERGSLRIDARSLKKGERSGEALRSDLNVVEDRFAIATTEDFSGDEVLTLDAWRAQTGQDMASILR